MKKLRFLTAGESHGQALVGIIEGVPSGLNLTVEDIHQELRRRKMGYGRGNRQKMEDDSVKILSGVRHGKTLASPIALVIENKDWKNWAEIMQPEPFSGEVKRKLEVPRPGHADYVGGIKYNHEDMRNVLERASARETTMRVALGAIAKKILGCLGCTIGSRVVRIGSVYDNTELSEEFLQSQGDLNRLNQVVDARSLRVLSETIDAEMVSLIDQAKKEGETLGGLFEVIASGMPLGLGSYVQWDHRLEGEIGKAFLSLNAIKGVEVGLGFELATRKGSEAHDEFYPSPRERRVSFKTNRSGGIDGGMTTGQPIIVRAAMKPLATLMDPLQSVKLSTGQAEKAHVERSDVCAVPAAAVIGESLLALVLTEAYFEKFGGDSMSEIQQRVERWKTRL